MTKGRLEAFSDGVVAILITIMVLEFKVPHGADWAALGTLAPVGLAYVLSYMMLGIYWSNHHHLLHATHHVTGGIMWANLHLLFWLSLMPFGTAWMGETHLQPIPTAVYGMVLLGAGWAYSILVGRIVAADGADSPVARAVGRDVKGNASLVFYLVAIPTAFWRPVVAGAVYVLVALMWLVPDRRIERVLGR